MWEKWELYENIPAHGLADILQGLSCLTFRSLQPLQTVALFWYLLLIPATLKGEGCGSFRIYSGLSSGTLFFCYFFLGIFIGGEIMLKTLFSFASFPLATEYNWQNPLNEQMLHLNSSEWFRVQTGCGSKQNAEEGRGEEKNWKKKVWLDQDRVQRGENSTHRHKRKSYETKKTISLAFTWGKSNTKKKDVSTVLDGANNWGELSISPKEPGVIELGKETWVLLNGEHLPISYKMIQLQLERFILHFLLPKG